MRVLNRLASTCKMRSWSNFALSASSRNSTSSEPLGGCQWLERLDGLPHERGDILQGGGDTDAASRGWRIHQVAASGGSSNRGASSLGGLSPIWRPSHLRRSSEQGRLQSNASQGVRKSWLTIPMNWSRVASAHSSARVARPSSPCVRFRSLQAQEGSQGPCALLGPFVLSLEVAVARSAYASTASSGADCSRHARMRLILGSCQGTDDERPSSRVARKNASVPSRAVGWRHPTPLPLSVAGGGVFTVGFLPLQAQAFIGTGTVSATSGFGSAWRNSFAACAGGRIHNTSLPGRSPRGRLESHRLGRTA